MNLALGLFAAALLVLAANLAVAAEGASPFAHTAAKYTGNTAVTTVVTNAELAQS